MTTESAGCRVPGTSPSQGTQGVSLPRSRPPPFPHQPATCNGSLATPLTLSSPFSKQQGQLPCLTVANSRPLAAESTSNSWLCEKQQLSYLLFLSFLSALVPPPPTVTRLANDQGFDFQLTRRVLPPSAGDTSLLANFRPTYPRRPNTCRFRYKDLTSDNRSETQASRNK